MSEPVSEPDNQKPDRTFPLIVNVGVFIFILGEAIATDHLWMLMLLAMPVMAIVYTLVKMNQEGAFDASGDSEDSATKLLPNGK